MTVNHFKGAPRKICLGYRHPLRPHPLLRSKAVPEITSKPSSNDLNPSWGPKLSPGWAGARVVREEFVAE
eukprot:762196-Amphidinium_carterae.1